MVGFYLFHPFAGDLQLVRWRLDRLLQERVEHHNTPARPNAEEHPADAFLAFHAQLEMAISETHKTA
jgi:hypothetical protein